MVRFNLDSKTLIGFKLRAKTLICDPSDRLQNRCRLAHFNNFEISKLRNPAIAQLHSCIHSQIDNCIYAKLHNCIVIQLRNFANRSGLTSDCIKSWIRLILRPSLIRFTISANCIQLHLYGMLVSGAGIALQAPKSPTICLT